MNAPILTTILIFASTVANAQKPNDIQKAATTVTKNLVNAGKDPSCGNRQDDPKKKAEEPMVIASCTDGEGSTTDHQEVPLVIKEFKNIDAMPSGLKKLALASNLKPGGPIKVLIRENNDAVFTPTGALAFIVDPKNEDPFNPAYDMGNTHNTELEISQTNPKGVTYTLHGNSALYTMENGRPTYIDEKDGLLHVPIFFTEQNVFSFSVDNEKSKLKEDGLLWKAAVGIQTLNSTHTTKIGATGSQIGFHHAAGTKNEYMRIYIYDSDGKSVRNAAFLDFAAGLTKTIAEQGKCQIKLNGTVEPVLFTKPEMSRVQTRVDLEGIRLAKKSKITASASATTTVHKDGVEFTPMVSLGYERKKWGVQSTVSFPTGKLVNAVEYNWTKHPMNSLAIYYFIGSTKKKTP